ncbi:MAG: aromatic ring-hydroxylating dioxygenase subunit alpha [Alphaproteobacteria bacterium]|nr:aromatic ring-hydroxylating dioxygenase subunit alpha [Alphaproteobacteria bacterium]
MLSAKQNELVTRTGPGTPAGDLLRRYWQPAALVEELPDNRPIVPVRMLGEELVLFRDESGKYGLLAKNCCHRGADLSFGRLEDGGLRCPFHGWLYGTDGACLEQPAEPEGSQFFKKVRQPAYPCEERNGIVFTYMGPGEPPAFPEFDCFLAPDAYTFAFKGHVECNWLQALEVGIDPSHASYLHRFFEDEDPAENYGRQFRDMAGDTQMPVTKVLRESSRPRIEVEETDYGLRLISMRDLGPAQTHVRVTNLAFPNAFVIPMSQEIVITQWHVPVDDVNNFWFAIFTSFSAPVDKAIMREQRLQRCTLPGYKPKANKSNDYGFDPEEQTSLTYTGMGMDINVHDQWAVESLGPIQDRTIEHLGAADKAITAYRRMLIKAIDTVAKGKAPPKSVESANGQGLRGPVAIDAVAPPESWQTCWKESDLARRDASKWAKNPW